jgi:RND superfamily putative drug exporter
LTLAPNTLRDGDRRVPGPVAAHPASVFLAFVTQRDVIAKMFCLGLGLAVLIDVLIIAPAVVTLLGDHAWWLPKWLDKALPNVSLERHLVEGLDAKDREPVGAAV